MARHLRMTQRKLFACGSLVVSCGSRDDKSSPKAVEDIVSVQRRDDGSFDVICRNGSRQVASAEEIRNNAVCGTAPSPVNGSQPVGDCLTAAKAVFGQRRANPNV